MNYYDKFKSECNVIWTRISSQQTQVLKWIVLLDFTWLEVVDVYIGSTKFWSQKKDTQKKALCHTCSLGGASNKYRQKKDTVCKIEVKCNIPDKSVEILSICQNYPTQRTLQKWQQE